MNETTLAKLGYVWQPDGSYARAVVAARLLAAQPEPGSVPALDGGKKIQGRGAQRYRLRYVFFRTRLTDPDAAGAGIKFLTDGLRYAGFIADDTASHCVSLEVVQIKVARKDQTGTLIEITPIED